MTGGMKKDSEQPSREQASSEQPRAPARSSNCGQVGGGAGCHDHAGQLNRDGDDRGNEEGVGGDGGEPAGSRGWRCASSCERSCAKRDTARASKEDWRRGIGDRGCDRGGNPTSSENKVGREQLWRSASCSDRCQGSCRASRGWSREDEARSTG